MLSFPSQGSGLQPVDAVQAGAGCTAHLRLVSDLGLPAAPFSPTLLLSACASPWPQLMQLQINRQGEPGSNSRLALLSPGRHRHGSFRSRLFRSKNNPSYQQRAAAWFPVFTLAGYMTQALGFWTEVLGPLMQSHGTLQLPPALS